MTRIRNLGLLLITVLLSLFILSFVLWANPLTHKQHDHDPDDILAHHPHSHTMFTAVQNPQTSAQLKHFVLHRANTRGVVHHGWLHARHYFSFGSWQDPDRMNFGVLRVLNDDSVAANCGFGAHPHDNMEIITIPLKGQLTHEDNMGHKQIIYTNDVQVMSAGTGIVHSEWNRHPTESVELFQIWLYPRERGVKPRYQQLRFEPADRQGKWQQLLSPNAEDAGVWIHQDAWFHRGEWKASQTARYDLRRKGNGLYMVVISGEVKIGDQVLQARDALGVWDVSQVDFEFLQDTDVLLLDVPIR